MRAAITHAFGQPPRITDVPDPTPGEGEVLLRVRAVGVCGSDVKVNSGALPGVRLPLVQGHEVAGEIVGDGHGFADGQRAAAYIFQPCGQCPWCLRGETTLCPTAPRIGFERDGGLADYLVMRPQDLLPFGDGLDFAEAAVAMDAVTSPWRALHVRGRMEPGQKVLVVGAGGLGLHACQIARAAGARVAVVDVSAHSRRLAGAQGAELAVDPSDTDPLKEWSGDGVDLALEASGSPQGFATAAAWLRPGGTLVCCGYKPGHDFGLDSTTLALGEINVVGSRGGSLSDSRDALAAVERGDINPIIAGTGTLDDVGTFIRRLSEGDVVGRLVVRL
ncbi:alcohol dehydrogenase catalytic domain-containing protein [Streptomyces sp. NPDC002490]|uniref:alcohol dehydrogenase catalytic domain-containing protein n=1 Tax=Streptomyces sp. NPDC002490 TaxID=3154416 RepID=UPI00332BA360